MERADSKGPSARLFALLFAFVLAAYLARALFNSTAPLIADTDDAMRLAVIRDLMAGQPWYDHLQHRLNAPFGAEMHWSKLADLPIAGLIVLLSPIAGEALATTIAVYLWPSILLFGLLLLTTALSLRLAGPEGLLPGMALPALSLPVMAEFSPGRIDHHSLQILLMLLMLWATIKALDRPRVAILAGLAAATAIAIGVESLPNLAAVILSYGLIWVFRPERANAMRWFGLSFALGTLGHLAIAYPPERWLEPACDVISLTYASIATGTGIAFFALSLLPLGERASWVRLTYGAAAGGLLAVVLAVMFPECLRGPYSALDPWLAEHWLNRIAEAAPLWQSLIEDPVYPIAAALPPLIALGVMLWRILLGRPTDRAPWLVYALFLTFGIVTMLMQIRASRMVAPLAVPACAWLITVARERFLARKSMAGLAALLLAWIASAGVALAVSVSLVSAALKPAEVEERIATALAERRNCLAPEAFAGLAALPPQRVMTPIDLGSHLLAFTGHSVVAAPYHRNEDGVRDALDFFNRPIAEARAILDRRGVDLVILCPGQPEARGMPEAEDDSFVRLSDKNALPGWLEPLPLGESPLRAYRVVR